MKYRELIDKMTLEEKASFMSGKDFWTTESLQRLKIPSIFLADGPHGIRKQAESPDHAGLNASIPATCYPTAASVSNSWNLDLAEKLGEHLGVEAVSQEVNVLLGPGTNIKRNPLCGRNFEYFSEDPFLAGKLSAAYIRGIQSKDISACLKHFAANNQEFRRMVMDSVIDERALKEIYLKPFEIGIKEGNLKCLMSSYNLLNGSYTNENIHLMRDILRNEWKYEGVVVTDWGGSNDRVQGLIAGNSLEMPSANGETNQEIVEAVKEGIIDESILDENLDRLLTLIFDTSLEKRPEPFDIDKHHLFAEDVALESIVLLKNSNNVLPLNSKEKVAIIGDFAKKPRYQGAGSSIVNPTKLDSTLSVIGEFDLNYIGFEQGFHRYGKKSKTLLKRALDLASKADTVLLYLALDEYSEAEGMDRLHMSLPSNQLELLEQLASLNKKIVVVLASGSAIEMDWENQVEAILHSSLSGQAGARAILKIITGLVNPSGKLSETYANKYEDYPSSNYFPGKEVNSLYKESIFVGYRYFDLNTKRVRYPFGYGLSYSKFKYSDLKVENSVVSFKIQNLSEVKGKEVSQLYVRAINSSVFRPYKELKGFSKVEIEPNQTAEVHILLSESAFEFYNVDSGKWEIEDLDYEIIIGSSSQEIQLKTIIHMEGKKVKPTLTAKLIPSYFSGNVKNVDDNEFEKVLMREIPDSSLKFYKKNRIKVDYNTPISDLRYAKGWTGRFLNWCINFIIKYYKLINKRDKANFIIMGIQHLPMRGIARMTAGKISHKQLDALITMFNGAFFKGAKQFFKAKKQKKHNFSKK